MKKEDYKIINDFFNDVSLELFNDADIENYYYNFIVLNDNYTNFFKKRYFSFNSYQNQTRVNNLTFQDVLDISREVIKSFNPAYIEKFDELLNSGIIDFSYDHEYYDSHVLHSFYEGKINEQLININRSFNYSDVETIVHEFMHYVNFTGLGIRNKIIGEFISIYFELYTDEYIYKKYKFDSEELFYNNRLINIYASSSDILKIEIPLLLYKIFGNLDEESYKLASIFLKKYEKKDYDYECIETVKIFNKYSSNEKEDAITFVLKSHYYVIATFLAFYFRKKDSLKNIINFIENFNDIGNKELSLLELLEKYNLIIGSDLDEVIISSIEEYLDIFEAEKRQR